MTEQIEDPKQAVEENDVDPRDEDLEDEHLEWVSLDDLHDDPENVRSEYTEIEELAESIKKHGLLQNITVRRDSEGKYVIIMGHRRKRALREAGLLRTRVVVKHKDLIPDEVLAQMLAENVSRVALDPIDEARGLQRLKKSRNLSDVQLAQHVGKGQPWVSSRLRLLELDAEDQEKVRTKRMSIGAGATRARLQGGHTRPGAIGKTVSHLSAAHALSRQVERRCESLGHKRGPNQVGGVGCGACWEVVIRQDERKTMSEKALEVGQCGTCGSQVEKAVSDES